MNKGSKSTTDSNMTGLSLFVTELKDLWNPTEPFPFMPEISVLLSE